MSASEIHSGGLLHLLINASAGSFKQYRITFWAQLIFGALYSFNYFNSAIAGFILGFFLPVFWIILTYRFVLIKAKHYTQIHFPRWMQKNPGNILFILADIIFLALIWLMIISGFYSATWLKVLFTIVFPIVTLSMLRNLVIYPIIPDAQNENSED